MAPQGDATKQHGFRHRYLIRLTGEQCEGRIPGLRGADDRGVPVGAGVAAGVVVGGGTGVEVGRYGAEKHCGRSTFGQSDSAAPCRTACCYPLRVGGPTAAAVTSVHLEMPRLSIDNRTSPPLQ